MKRAGLTLRRGALLVLLTLLLCVGAFAEKAPAEPSATEQLKAALTEALPARQTVVEVASDGLEQYADEQLLVDLLREMAAKSADDPEAGLDYDVLNIHALYTRVENGVLRVTLEYLTTAEQEQAVDEACAKIRADLQLDGKTETERVLALYEYVGTHFVYDDTLQIFSAYEGLRQGKMVCQGYAILLYKLLWQEQIPCRIVTGYAGGVGHGWNIVQLDGKWYSLDVTWDACKTVGGAMTFDCFLKGGALEGHTRGSWYRTDAFEAAHRMAGADYPVPRVRVQVREDGTEFSSLMIRKNIAVPLRVSVEGVQDAAFTFRSTDPAIVSVTEDGTMTAHATGAVSIIIRASGRTAIPAMFTVTAVDLTGASDWAQADVTALYLAGYLPAVLCSDWQQPITRGELAQLIYPMVTRQPRAALRSLGFEFDDTDEAENGDVLEYLATLGLVNGFGDGRLAPEAPLTREQAAKILTRLCALYNCPLPEAAEKRWVDRSTISDWAQGFCDRADAAGIMQGIGGGRFAPRQALTREQAMCALWRAVEYCRQTAAAA